MSIQQRLEKNLKRLGPWAKSAGYEAYRLYEKDIPEYPFVVDIYGPYALVYEQGKKIETKEDEDLRQKHWKEVTDAILAALKIPQDHLIFKKRESQLRTQKYQRLGDTNNKIAIQEANAKFLVNLWDYVDTGLFLDHRPLRAQLRKRCEGKRVLNLFSYTCSLSVAAAIGGASQVISVDLSQKYLDWGKENFIANGLSLEQHYFINKDVLEFLDGHHEKYDLILLDPPTFSNSKKMREDLDIQDDHVFLINHCMRLLRPDGLLIFSNNKRDFKLSTAISNKYLVNNVTKTSIPQDFRSQKTHHCFELANKDD